MLWAQSLLLEFLEGLDGMYAATGLQGRVLTIVVRREIAESAIVLTIIFIKN